MEYVYAAMLLHKVGKSIDEAGLKKVIEAAGIKPDETRIKVLVAALEGVEIEEAIKTAAVAPAAPAPVAAAPNAKQEKTKEEKKAEEKVEENQAAAGLGALFG